MRKPEVQALRERILQVAASERGAKKLSGTVDSQGPRHEKTWRLEERLGTLGR